MRAAGITSFGGSVTPMDIAEPRPPAADEVVLEVRGAGVGNWDQVVLSGDWDVGRTPPLVLGVEASGVVLACGASVEYPRVGDAVLTHPLPLRDQGCWAEHLVVSAGLQVIALAGGEGVGAAVNAARGQAGEAIEVVAPGGRFATITGDPPVSQRGIQVSNFYVRGGLAGRLCSIPLLRPDRSAATSRATAWRGRRAAEGDGRLEGDALQVFFRMFNRADEEAHRGVGHLGGR